MSFPYRVRVSASISAPIKGRQESRRQITLDLPLVPKERLRDRLLEELERGGFERQSDGTLVRRRGEVTERIDPETLVATASVEREATVEASMELEVAARRGQEKAAARHARARMEEQLLRNGIGQLERELSERVDAAGASLERDLNEAIGKVYVEAMEERARTLGDVESVKRERIGDEIVLEIKVTVSD